MIHHYAADNTTLKSTKRSYDLDIPHGILDITVVQCAIMQLYFPLLMQ